MQANCGHESRLNPEDRKPGTKLGRKKAQKTFHSGFAQQLR
jgi:hypothetical protein